jgi:hypothetical protein
LNACALVARHHQSPGQAGAAGPGSFHGGELSDFQARDGCFLFWFFVSFIFSKGKANDPAPGSASSAISSQKHGGQQRGASDGLIAGGLLTNITVSSSAISRAPGQQDFAARQGIHRVSPLVALPSNRKS